MKKSPPLPEAQVRKNVDAAPDRTVVKKLSVLMKKLSLLLLFIFLSPVFTLADTQPLKVGLLLPLTGPGATWGKHLQNGARLAAPKGSSLELIVEDDHLDAAAAVTAYKKLAAIDQVRAILVFGSQSAHAVVPLAEREKIASLVVTTDPKSVKDTTHAVRLALGAKPQADSLLGYLKQQGLTRVALLGTTHEAMLEYLSAITAAAPGYGVDIVFSQDVPKGETDFRTTTERMHAAKPDAVVLSLLPPSLSTFAKQYKLRNSSPPLFAFAQAENADEIKAAGGALDGLIFSKVVISDEFTKTYLKTYGETPQSYAAYSFDLITLLKQAYAKSGDVERAISAMRAEQNFSGACGTISAGSNFAFEPQAQLVKVAGDTLSLVSQPASK
jgi:ABC-type branched-subunit amino acid transport system substrate-binding protein